MSLDSNGNLNFTAGGSGVTLQDDTRRPRLFKITSGTNPYAASEVVLTEVDGSRAVHGYVVTVANKLLWEINGVTTVAADSIVIGKPNPFGVGFYFDSGKTDNCEPIVFRVQIDTYEVKTMVGGVAVVTDIVKKFRDITVDANGCVTLGVPYCEDATTATCASGEVPSTPGVQYYCLTGKCFAVYPPATPPTGSVGPFPTAAACAASPCTNPPTTGTGGTLACCARAGNYTMFASVSGNGTIVLTYDGSTYWQGSKALVCGETLHIRFNKATCGMEYSCDGATWLPVTTGVGQSCGPPFVSNAFADLNMNTGTAGCNTAACGVLTCTVGE